MVRVRRELIKLATLLATGGVVAGSSGCGDDRGGIEETLFLVSRIIDIWV